jgi:hypothetical protein
MTRKTDGEAPEIGSRWISRDPRDDGLVVTVLAVANGFVRIQRYRKTNVSLRRFRRDYEPVESSAS